MNMQPLKSSHGLGTAFLQLKPPMNHISLLEGCQLLQDHYSSNLLALPCLPLSFSIGLLFFFQLHESTLLFF